MYSCADGLLMETTRLLAVRGAKLLLNSLNSFAEDEANLHIPVRAAENKVFVAAACKVDYLVPKHILAGFAEKMKIKPEALQGAGESQIVAPDGSVLAKANRADEDVVFADIDLSEADNTELLAARRPEIYCPIAEKPAARNYKSGAKSVIAATFVVPPSGGIFPSFVVPPLGGILNSTQNPNARLIVLPELSDYKIPPKGGTTNFSPEGETTNFLPEGGTANFVVTSIVEKTEKGLAHVGVLIDESGVIFRQKQIHRFRQNDWITDFGDKLETFDLPFGKLAIIVGEDALFPEVFRLAAYQNVEIVAVPFNVQARWETEFGLPERAAENRVSIVAATRPNPNLGEFGTSLIATISADFTLWTEWKTRPFDGNINFPIIHRGENIEAEIFPANAENRFVSQQTDVVDGRAWQLLAPLVKSS